MPVYQPLIRIELVRVKHLNHFLNAPHRPNERNRQKNKRYYIQYTEIDYIGHRLDKNDVGNCENYERHVYDT